jgi:uncharacterized protein (TIGR02246 family)
MRNLMFTFLATIALVSAASAQDLGTIQAHTDRFAAALNAGDAQAIAQIYAEDARILPPGAEMVEGRDAIQGYWKAAVETFTDAKLTTTDIKPLGDSYAREIGSFSSKTTGDNPQEITGKYIIIWQQVGEDWKISDDIWNINK